MALQELVFICMLYVCVSAANVAEDGARKALAPEQDDDDLKTAASGTYYGAYSNYPGGNYGYGVSGYGLLDDKYYGAAGGGGYDNSLGYGGVGGGYGGYGGYGGGVGGSGYPGYTGYSGGYGGYNKGYGGGYGGYGGYGGNGGLNSYYGYNNPSYQGANHLGYGYYGKRAGYGNIYNNGVTPSLVTGYRGYSRR